MKNETRQKGMPAWATIVAAVLSLVSAVAVAVIGYQSIVLQTEIANSIEQGKLTLEQAKLELEKESTGLKQEGLALDKSRFEAEQRARRDAIIKEYVPMLLSPNELDRQTAVAVLFVIYPNDATVILSQVAEALDEDQARVFEPLIEQAQNLDEKTGDWAVVISTDPDLEGTEWEVETATDYGYGATVYLIDDWFVTTIGPFSTELQAESARITVRTTFPGGDYRQGAYVVNLNTWCPQHSAEQDEQGRTYFECQSQ